MAPRVAFLDTGRRLFAGTSIPVALEGGEHPPPALIHADPEAGMGVASNDRMATLAAACRAPSVRSGHDARRHAVSVAESALAARLRELGASAASLEDALEPMLQAILETTGATAGAFCLYDIPQQALRLATEIGLSDEGSRKLRHIARRGEGDSWSIPLHGMLNRRCYLIENAAQNRFVPPLIPDAKRIETVACLPIYSGETPLASLILVTRTPRTLGERELHGIEAPVHEIGRWIETMRQRTLGRGTKPPMPASVPAIDVGASGAIATALPSADGARFAAELARVERERERVAAELETSQRDAHGKTEAYAAELERLRTQLAEAEAGAAHEQRAREELEARLAAGISAGRDELRKALEAAREAESARAAALAEMAELRIELEYEQRNARAEASRVSARLLEEAETQLHTLPDTLDENRIAEVDALYDRLAALSAEVDRLRETQAVTNSERDRLAGDLARMVASRAHLEEASKAALEEATMQLRDARVQAWNVAARLLETETTLDAAREEYRGQVASLTTQIGALREELTVVRAISVRAARVNARAIARQRVIDLRDVVRNLEGCADAIDRIRVTAAEPLRDAAARIAGVASNIDGEYGRADSVEQP